MSLIEPTLFEKHKTAFIVGSLVAALILVGIILWAFSGNGDKEVPLITNIGVSQGVNGVTTNLVVNQQGVVNESANNTNRAVNDLGNSVNKRTNQFSNNGAVVNDRFCRDFPQECP